MIKWQTLMCPWWIVGALCLALNCLALTGCDEGEPSATETQLHHLATVYLNYVAATGTPPAAEQMLVKQMANLAPFVAAENPLPGDGKSLPFRSQRDGAPFVVRYGQGISLAEGQAAPVIAYEQQGADGTRYVAYANGKVECLSDDEARRLIDEI
jgi:hypothetical protein